MTNYRDILRLLSLGYTQRQIAASVHCSRDTVRDVDFISKKLDIKWPLAEYQTNQYLQSVFRPEKVDADKVRKEPNYAYIHNELAKSGVNLSLLWNEYCSKCHNNGEIPYMYTQFCDKYRHWAKVTKATMRIKHKPGDMMMVDWAGNTIPIYDKSGYDTCAYLFIAVLPCSCYTYAEATSDMKSENWLLCHTHAYSYFNGVTRLLKPDNLKTGVTANTRYETILNKSYQELAEYYNTAIVPARVEHPKDKSLAEGTVKYASTWIIAALRNQKFFSIDEVKVAVAEKLEELNHFPFKKREGNRYDAYVNEEQAFMKPLPLTPYEPAVWSTAKVLLDYLISDGKNKYSVPFDLIGETVDIKLTQGFVEVFFKGNRVALHQRAKTYVKDPIIIPEHMPEAHRKFLTYNADDFFVWATAIGPNTSAVIKYFLTADKEPEQGFKACASLTKLKDRYGSKRMEKACEKVLAFTNAPTIRIINTYLKNDKIISQKEKSIKEEDKHYGITRGASYFSQGGDA